MSPRRSPVKHKVRSHRKDSGARVGQYVRGSGTVKTKPHVVVKSSLSSGQIIKRFKKEAKHIWDNSEIIDKLKISVEFGTPNHGLAAIKWDRRSTGKAIGEHLYQSPGKIIIVVSDRFLDMSPQEQSVVLRHEAGHLGYPRHTKDFHKLMAKKGGIFSQEHLATGKVKVQVKDKKDKRGRYSTIKTFDDIDEADKYGRTYAKKHLGEKVRLIF